MNFPAGNFWRYLLNLWPLLIVLILGQLIMRASGNSAELGISLYISLLDLVVFIALFSAAAWWAYQPLFPCLDKSDQLKNHHRVTARVIANFPWRALGAYAVAGWAFAIYLIAVVSSAAIMGGHAFNWRIFAALMLNFCFTSGVLAPALSIAISMRFTTYIRLELSRQGLFVSQLQDVRSGKQMIESSYRPWLVFMVTGLLPTLILALYVYLALAGAESEKDFILSQAMVLLATSVMSSIFLVWIISSTIQRVTQVLEKGLRQLGAGQFEGRVPVLLDDDFGDLARGLNTAMAGLQEREDLKDSLFMAAEIQQGLLPRFKPVIPGYKFNGFQQTCFSVGGDYYDYIVLEDGRIWIMIADVSGKGYPAALTMANLQAMLRGLAKLNWPIEDAINYLNEALCDSLTAGRFVTLFMGKLQPLSHSLVWVNAGQAPPMMVTKDGIRTMEASAPPLGVLRDVSYEVDRTEFEGGDTLLAYTDGATDTSNRSGKERYGEKRLRRWLMANKAEPLEALPAELLDELNAFGRDERDDDLTLLCIRRE
jgi:HAMP domain-containing protein